MKYVLSLTALLAVLITGSQMAIASDIPNLVGTWKGMNSAVHTGNTGHFMAKNKGVNFADKEVEFTFTITEQKGNDFAGQVSSKNRTEDIIGSISPDNKNAVVVDEDGQYTFAIRSAQTIDVCYWHVLTASRLTTCYTVERQK